MSEENVELAYRVIDAMNQRDLDAFLALMDEDVEALSRIVAVEGSLHGHDGIRHWWKSWFDVFPDYQIEVVDVRDHGELIIGALRAVGHGAGSEVPLQDTIWNAAGGGGGSASGGAFSTRRTKPSKPPGSRSR